MARKIDFNKPLSAEDAQYVSDRPWLRQEAELSGLEVRFEDDEFVVDSDDSGVEQTAVSDGAVEGNKDGIETGDDEVESYDQWDYNDLKAEAKERGLTASGSKEQLIERLQENDEAETAE